MADWKAALAAKSEETNPDMAADFLLLLKNSDGEIYKIKPGTLFSDIDALVYKGVIDCSANPNYPAADAGHVYKVSVAGKIGGGSGPNVEAGDTLICHVDSTASGTHAGVGANWGIIQTNIDGAPTAATSTTEQLTGTNTTKYATADSVAALWEKGADIASSGTISVGEGGFFHITGTTTITDIDFGTDKSGRRVWVVFDGILTLTHHSTTLILPTGANITTAAGDTACFVSEDGSDNVRCVSYVRKDGTALVGSGSAFGKQTMFVPSSAMLQPTTGSASWGQLESATNKLNYVVLDFDGTTQEYAQFQVAFPKSWDEGTVTFKAWWATTNSGTAGIAIGLQGIALSDADTIDTAFGTAVYVTDAAQSSAAKLYATAESGAVTIGGSPAEGDLVYFRVTRDPSNGSDTMSEDMRLIGIQLYFTTNANNDA